MKMNVKTTKGITLVSLVVTIIILIILAGVSINMIIGQDGIITIAKRAKENMELARIEEETQLNELYTQLGEDGTLGGLDYDAIAKLDEFKSAIADAITQKGVETSPNDSVETMVENIGKLGEVGTGTGGGTGGGSNTFTTVANEPNISDFNINNTYYVSWNLTSSPYVINDTTLISGTAPSNWYDYTEGVNHWANIKTTGGGNDCYWVWIPRYAYCITEGYHTNTAGTIDIKFLQGTTNTPIDGSNITISNSSGSGNWNVHPAFWFDKNNNGIEEEGEQLTGIWVAKYEASSSSVSTINLENGTLTGDITSLNGTGGGTNTSLQVRVKPNVTSWRGLNVNGIFEVCQNLTKTINGQENSLVGSTNLDSHMMKNTEWGAVAYLSSSKYGKTDSSGNRVRVYNNPYYKGTTNYSPITGLSGKTETQVNNATTADLYIYNTQEGVQASTTGNVYGIYDMAGGAGEYVAGIYTRGGSNADRSKLLDSDNLKYVDQYTEAVGTAADYYGNTNKYGDAVYETSSSGNSETGCWDSGSAVFNASIASVSIRGVHAYLVKKAGVFAYGCSSGVANASLSFRPVVLSSQS